MIRGYIGLEFPFMIQRPNHMPRRTVLKLQRHSAWPECAQRENELYVQHVKHIQETRSSFVFIPHNLYRMELKNVLNKTAIYEELF
jgi:hypothetical protein